MTISADLKQIKKLAKKKGKTLLDIQYHGRAVAFVYNGSKSISYWYPNIIKGIQGELKRLV